MKKLLRRLRYLWNRRQLEADLQREMRAHREMMTEDRRASFGSSLRFQEESRDAWGWNWLDHLQRDLAYAAGQLRRAPGFTLAAVTILALGVGLNLAVFHVVKTVSYDRLLVPEAESLVRVVRESPERERWAFPPEAVTFFQDQCGSIHLSGRGAPWDHRGSGRYRRRRCSSAVRIGQLFRRSRRETRARTFSQPSRRSPRRPARCRPQ